MLTETYAKSLAIEDRIREKYSISDEFAILRQRDKNPEEFAEYDVSKIYYLDKHDQKVYGPHWTASQIDDATKALSFPAGTTKWDKYVAYNVMWTDLTGDFNDEEILRAAYKFFFKDPDFKSDTTTKLWQYMNCKY